MPDNVRIEMSADALKALDCRVNLRRAYLGVRDGDGQAEYERDLGEAEEAVHRAALRVHGPAGIYWKTVDEAVGGREYAGGEK